ELKKSFVIFICTFDYFKDDRYMYTFVNQCQENGKIFLNDGTTSIVLNVNGTIGEIDEELKGALRYMAGQAPLGSYAKTLAAAVQEAKINKKWRMDYMFYELKVREREREAERRGTERGKEIGSIATNVSQVRENREEETEEQIKKFLRIDKKLYDKICEMIDDNPDMNDWEIAEAIVEENE
ncbi:MAG: hypothetical protein J6X44_00930, partial [Thermoguttaceae bacterium]|nr:hypothetical protein [Thermoguttaceae bacterium]